MVFDFKHLKCLTVHLKGNYTHLTWEQESAPAAKPSISHQKEIGMHEALNAS